MPRGYLIPIGGAEEKHHEPHVLRRFVKLCGARHARIAVIPTASELRDTGARYEQIFGEIGVRAVKALPFETRHDCEREDWLAFLEEVDGVFFTGGNQLRLATHLGGTPVVHLLKRRHAEGMHVAGTSAGAAILSEHMIASGDEGPSPHHDMVVLAPGIGLTSRLIIDQHFRQRDRLGRLLTAVSFNPYAIGIGLDEDTAAFIGPDDVFEVHGSGAVTVVDASGVSHSSMDRAHKHDPVCVIGVKLHVLVEGASFDIRAREARPPR